MKISYNWLNDYLPPEILNSKMVESPQKMAAILTSVGLEVEDIHSYGDARSLQALLVGEVITCEKHPNADKLSITTVSNGHGETLQIVCGAPNVAAGQKVVIAPVGATIYPLNQEPVTIKKTTIRGIESNGMLCAEDEIGVGERHKGIIVLPADTKTGTSAYDYYRPSFDTILEIGLTPNRMDAMSHMGVAKDVCAYLSHHQQPGIKMVSPFTNNFKSYDTSNTIEVTILDTKACARYAGISISGITIGESPDWLQRKLRGIGVRPISNIVDITNFILHETGQPLHAFDAGAITQSLPAVNAGKIVVRTLAEGTLFTTLDEKIRVLSGDDLMICNGNGYPMCIGGVFGGFDSGVTDNTKNIFLESAWFNPASIRKSSFRHNLRTEAAVRFEKGVDIGNTVHVLKRAALLIKEICGGEFTSEIIDIYPAPKQQKEVTLQNKYLEKLSGKKYAGETVKNILKSLNFSIISEGNGELTVAAPFSNPDIAIPADIVEEIMRIDGLDNVAIPAAITLFPGNETGAREAALKEKVAGWLTGNGFSEIFTNSITNSKYFTEATLSRTVKIINSLSEGLNVMRPSMMPTGLESVAYNLNRKNQDILFFEFGKIYSTTGAGKYTETDSLALYFTGNKKEGGWKTPAEKMDIFFVKGICKHIFSLAGLTDYRFAAGKHDELDDCIFATSNDGLIAEAGSIQKTILEKSSIKQPVFYLSVNWRLLVSLLQEKDISFLEIPKFPQVHRDLSIIVDKKTSYQSLEDSVTALHLTRLISIKLFDVFENEKIGVDKKSLAISFVFSDREKTLTDRETDEMMARIIHVFERDWNAEIRRTAW
ncbi:MAG: phenylalanine--tRNA ligase subunit beta [Ginsengibacter sp.]